MTSPDGAFEAPQVDPILGRRSFLAGAIAAAGVALLDPVSLARARRAGAALPAGELFPLGVASGDPTGDGVILWTRLLAPGGALPSGDVAVEWEVATDETFDRVVAGGTAPAVAALGHSVHVDVTGLAADREYHYRFSVDGRTSPSGRTRTFPGAGSSTGQVRFALATCQNYCDGHYTAYADMVTQDPDLVVFVGDYIYEAGGNRGVRPFVLPTAVDVPTYRARYELFKSDPNLQEAHRRFPWIITMDDHEVANNGLGDNGMNGEAEGDPTAVAAWRRRRADAFQVWYEHLPVRLSPPTGPDWVMYRVVDHSDLVRFHVLDGRQYRSTYAAAGPQALDNPERRSESQTMLGAAQEAWLDEALAASRARWNVIAQQTVMTAMPITVGPGAVIYNYDQWDGYAAARDRLVRSLLDHDVSNPMILTGDIHLGAMASIRADFDDPDSPDVAHEVVATSISSRFDPALLDVVQTAVDSIPWARYGNGHGRGYALVTVTADRWRTDFRVADVTTTQGSTHTDFTDVVSAWSTGPDVDPDPAPSPPTTSTTTTSTTTTPDPSPPTVPAPDVHPPSPTPTTVPAPASAPGRPGGSRPATGARPRPGRPRYRG